MTSQFLLLSGMDGRRPKIMEGVRAPSTLFFRQEKMFPRSLARLPCFLLLSLWHRRRPIELALARADPVSMGQSSQQRNLIREDQQQEHVGAVAAE